MLKNTRTFDTYFNDGLVKEDFNNEFVSIFDGWLGLDNLDELDHVTDCEWSRFNTFLGLLMQNYEIHKVDFLTSTINPVDDIVSIATSHKESQAREAAQFTHIVIPKLRAVFAEDWDYTWILSHQNDGAVDALSPLIREAELFHWNDLKAQK